MKIKPIYKKKAIYNSRDRSIFHQFLKEEGLSRIDTSIHLDISPPTLDKYLENPYLFNVNQLDIISDITNVDIPFLLDLIFQHKEVNNFNNKRNNIS
tara:strand:- start:2084 stop:2374 length:291 start_codon:yes stop_codon:yes gene_type:complete